MPTKTLTRRRVWKSDALVAKMKRDDMTIQGLADLIGMTHETVRRYVIGASEPSISTLYDLAEIFSCDADSFVRWQSRSAPTNRKRRGRKSKPIDQIVRDAAK